MKYEDLADTYAFALQQAKQALDNGRVPANTILIPPVFIPTSPQVDLVLDATKRPRWIQSTPDKDGVYDFAMNTEHGLIFGIADAKTEGALMAVAPHTDPAVPGFEFGKDVSLLIRGDWNPDRSVDEMLEMVTVRNRSAITRQFLRELRPDGVWWVRVRQAITNMGYVRAVALDMPGQSDDEASLKLFDRLHNHAGFTRTDRPRGRGVVYEFPLNKG